MNIGPDERLHLYWSTAGICLALDQLTKTIIAILLPLGHGMPVTSFFNIVHVMNAGAAFSFLADQPGWQRWFFIAIALGASAFLVLLIRRRPPRGEAVAYAMILAGALGNLTDRVARKAVVDWLDLHWGRLHWPAFNLADVAITVGAGLLICRHLSSTRRQDETPPSRA